MAEWKKIVVSGSNVSQLFNDVGYLTSQSFSGSFTGSFSGSHTGSLLGTASYAISASWSTSSLSASYAFAAERLTTGDKAITGSLNVSVGVKAIGFTGSISGSRSNFSSSITENLQATNNIIQGNNSSYQGASSVVVLGSSNAVSASYAVAGGGVNNLITSTGFNSFVVGRGNEVAGQFQTVVGSFNVSSSSPYEVFTIGGGTSASNRKNIALFSTSSVTISGSLDVQNGITGSMFGTASYATSASMALTASYALNGGVLSISGSTSGNGQVSLSSQALIVSGTVNEIEATVVGQTIQIGLPDDVIIAGNLTVNGITTTINTTNLEIEDKFVLFASGSTSATDGGFIVQQTAGGLGQAFLYDSAQSRWAVTGSLGTTATTAAPDGFISTVVDLNVAQSTDKSEYQKNGNIKIDTNGDIYIFS